MIEMLRQNADKFWERVAKRGDDECWLWMTNLDCDGYGSFQFRHQKKKEKIRANRAAYMITHNCCISSNQFVCHTCDNPQCVNPSHLVLGDCKTNIADCVKKGRQKHYKGIRNAAAKLTDEQVIDIRDMTTNGLSQQFVAEQFGVTRTVIAQIVQGKTWKHV